jgi:hypothetical protein
MDLYNRALTETFATADGEHFEFVAGPYPLPFGTMDVSFDAAELEWGKRLLVQFVPAADLEVTGFRNRYRQPGIGAPLAAATEPIDPNEPMRDFVGPNVRVPVTALLRVPEPRRQLLGDHLSGELEVHTVTEPLTTDVGSREVPLEPSTSSSGCSATTAANRSSTPACSCAAL